MHSGILKMIGDADGITSETEEVSGADQDI